MYYPYLYGKQFELLALREFLDQYADNCQICPIIEPVKSSFNSLRIAVKKFQETNIPFALVVNPSKGDYSKNIKMSDDDLNELLIDCTVCIPSYIVNANTAINVIRQINEKKYVDVLLICDDSVDLNKPEYKSLLEMSQVKRVIFPDNNRSFKRELSRLGKDAIRLDDNFKTQKRNSDYSSIPEEFFSEEVFYYKTEDHFAGFSDYTVLSSEFIDGGMLPKALAMHFTYLKNQEIWIRHFVSDSNEDNSNIQGKFGEAANKVIGFFQGISYTNQAIKELTNYYSESQYPGLGVLKKLAIKSHLELINSILTK